jgi:hypothetical protein
MVVGTQSPRAVSITVWLGDEDQRYRQATPLLSNIDIYDEDAHRFPWYGIWYQRSWRWDT